MMIPIILEEELFSFQALHFSSTSTNRFAADFLGPVKSPCDVEESGISTYGDEAEYIEEEDDDDLGYYPDGKKRTLTDDQIAIFRHSEIQTILRERRHVKEAMQDGVSMEGLLEEETEKSISKPVQNVPQPFIGPVLEADLEDGELEDGDLSRVVQAVGQSSSFGKKKKKSKKNAKGAQKTQGRPPQPKGFFKQNVKPDLRKRTWDKVEQGVAGLDYDEMEGGESAEAIPAKRRQIFYDD